MNKSGSDGSRIKAGMAGVNKNGVMAAEQKREYGGRIGAEVKTAGERRASSPLFVLSFDRKH